MRYQLRNFVSLGKTTTTETTTIPTTSEQRTFANIKTTKTATVNADSFDDLYRKTTRI